MTPRSRVFVRTSLTTVLGISIAFLGATFLPGGWMYVPGSLYAFAREWVFADQGSTWRGVMENHPQFGGEWIHRMARTQILACVLLAAILIAIAVWISGSLRTLFPSVLFAQIAAGCLGAAMRSRDELLRLGPAPR